MLEKRASEPEPQQHEPSALQVPRTEPGAAKGVFARLRFCIRKRWLSFFTQSPLT